MNEDKIIDFFDNLLENPEKASNNIEETLEQSTAFFSELMDTIHNGNEEDQKMIGKTMELVGKKLSEKFDQMCDEAGIGQKELEEIMNDPKNFTPEIWKAMEEMKKDRDLSPTKMIEKATSFKVPIQKKKRKKTKNWLTA